MSGLAGLLAHHVEPGIYRWHGHFPVEDVRHTVEHSGWRFAEVDGWHHTTKAEFLEAVGIALDFPDYYGHNLDAFNDCLRDVAMHQYGTSRDATGTVLAFAAYDAFARREPRAGRLIPRIIERQAHFAMLFGHSMVCLIQSADPGPADQ